MYETIERAFKEVSAHLGTFKTRASKPEPPLLRRFGWCTWDAFYSDVEPVGVARGLEELAEGGTPARFLILDDGWQMTASHGAAAREAKKERLKEVLRLRDAKKAAVAVKSKVAAKAKVVQERAKEAAHKVKDVLPHGEENDGEGGCANAGSPDEDEFCDVGDPINTSGTTLTGDVVGQVQSTNTDTPFVIKWLSDKVRSGTVSTL